MYFVHIAMFDSGISSHKSDLIIDQNYHRKIILYQLNNIDIDGWQMKCNEHKPLYLVDLDHQKLTIFLIVIGRNKPSLQV